MISVMIVDDMPIFREYLREAIDWQVYGFEICCEAKNGQEALELVKVHEPDIVLSDITMPFMDGLSLAENLKREYESTEVVLITGNSEFEYAKKAVKLGVADYIVKPFEKEELILTLLSLKDHIERTIELEIEKEDDLSRQRDQLLKQLIYSDDINDTHVKELQNIEINTSVQSCYYIAVIETEADLDHSENSEEAMSWKHVVGSLYNDYSQIEGKKYLFRDYENRIVFLNILESVDHYDVDNDELETLIEMIKQKTGFDVTIGMGTLYNKVDGIRKSYLESLNALNNRFIKGSNRVIYYEKVTEDNKGYGFYSAELNEVIINHLNQLNKSELLKVLDEIFAEADDLNYSLEYRRMMCMGLSSLLLSYVVKVGKNINDIFETGFKPYTVIQNETGIKLREYIILIYDVVIDYLLKHKASQSSIIASEAKACIDDNYNDSEFNMNTLTQHLLVNQTYLRKMFKSEFQMTISEYLVKVRMEHAKAHIKTGYYKLSAISEMVGYKDPGYFSKSFKKFYGVSPKDFQKNQ